MSARLARRIFAAVLRLYPREYRTRVGADAGAVFQDLYVGAVSRSERGRVLRVSLWGAVSGLAPAWFDALIRSGGGRGDGPSAGMGLRVRVRRLVREPTFTLSVLALLAVGIGSATSIATVVDGVLLRPLPYPEAERLVHVGEGGHSEPDIRAWRERVSSLEQVAGVRPGASSVLSGGRAERATVARTTEGFLDGLGARGALGRVLDATDFEAQRRVAVLSHGFWTRTFGADESVLGGALSVDGQSFEVVGVLAPGFRAPERLVGGGVDVWLPVLRSDAGLVDPESHALTVYGRRRPGVSLEQVQSEMERVMAELATELPDFHLTPSGAVLTARVRDLAEATTASVRTALLVLLAAAGLLLFAACANAAGLFLARGVAHRAEWSVRMALGATSRALVRDVLAEAALVTFAGAALGLLLARVGVQALVGLEPGLLPRSEEIGVGMRAVGYATLIAVATALLFGALPAMRATGATALGALRSWRGGLGALESRLQNGLVTVQVGLTTVLLLGAGLLTRGLLELSAVDLGVDVDGAVYVSVPLGRETAPEERRRVVAELRRAFESLPTVSVAGGGLTAPLQFTGGGRCCWSLQVTLDGVEQPGVWADPVSEGYFESLGIAFHEGRAFTVDDAVATPLPVILDATFAARLFGDERAIGRALELPLGAEGGALPAEVVGVTVPVRHWGPTDDPEPMLYLPWEAWGTWASRFGMAVAVDGDPASAVPSIREAARAVAPGVAVDVTPYADLAAETRAGPRFFALLTAVFAVAALLIASFGLFGTLLYQVRRRRRDVGIRLALGADGGRVAGQILLRGGATALVGALVGGLAFPLASRPLAGLLFGVTPTDPRTLVGVGAVLALTTAAATWLPARLAARTDPASVLRDD